MPKKQNHREPDIEKGLDIAKNIKDHQPKPTTREKQWRKVGESGREAKKRGGLIGKLIISRRCHKFCVNS